MYYCFFFLSFHFILVYFVSLLVNFINCQRSVSFTFHFFHYLSISLIIRNLFHFHFIVYIKPN
jgi:hypothetical protein